MTTALIVPLDFTAVLCCKEWVIQLTEKSSTPLVIICDRFQGSTIYEEELKKWGVIVEYLDMSRHISVSGDIKYLYSIYRILRSHEVDTVMCACTKPNLYGPIAARLAGVNRIMISIWGRGSSYVETNELRKVIVRKVLNNFYKLAFALSKAIWFTNRHDFEYFANLGIIDERKVVCTNNYVDTNIYNPDVKRNLYDVDMFKEYGIVETDKVIVLVGRMIWSKGIREFVDASRYLASKHPHFKFVLVGAMEETSMEAVPIAYLEQASKRDNFQWVGYRKDMLEIYSRCNLAVLPSYYKEGGYPRALTEPMAMGIPVIAADTNECRGPVTHSSDGLLVPIKDAKALSTSIIEILENRSGYNKMSLNAADKIRLQFDETNVIREMHCQVEKLISRPE